MSVNVPSGSTISTKQFMMASVPYTMSNVDFWYSAFITKKKFVVVCVFVVCVFLLYCVVCSCGCCVVVFLLGV